MQAKIMATDGGPHPAWKWAEHSADQIVDLIVIEGGSEAAEEARKAKPRFRLDITEYLEEHHEGAIQDERDALDECGAVRYADFHPERIVHKAHEHHPGHLENAVKAVVDAAQKYPVLASAFVKTEVQAAVRHILNDHMSHAMRVEHGWHNDRGGKTWRPAGHPKA